jgi:hypothetical protein
LHGTPEPAAGRSDDPRQVVALDLRHPRCADSIASHAKAQDKQLEPISKLLEQYAWRRKLHEAEEVGGMIFPAHQQSPLPLDPGKESLDDPAALISAQPPTILGLGLLAIRLVWRNQFNALIAKLSIQRIAVIHLVTDQVLRLRLYHVEVEGQLHQRDFMMVRFPHS